MEKVIEIPRSEECFGSVVAPYFRTVSSATTKSIFLHDYPFSSLTSFDHPLSQVRSAFIEKKKTFESFFGHSQPLFKTGKHIKKKKKH